MYFFYLMGEGKILKARIGIVGAGNVGATLAIALKQKGYPIAGIFCHTEPLAQKASQLIEAPYYLSPAKVSQLSDIVFITTPDRKIHDICAFIADEGGFRKGQVVLHTSGAHSSAILHPAQKMGALTLSVHPLQTFPDVKTGLQNLPGSMFTVEGHEDALPVASEIIRALGGLPLTIPTEMKPLYHASACVVCNYFVALVDLGLKMMETAGIPRDRSLQAFLPLIEGTLGNIKNVGVPAALTGPIERGDVSTIENHLAALKEVMPSVVDVYSRLGAYTARLAREKGTLSRDGETEICKMLEIETERQLAELKQGG